MEGAAAFWQSAEWNTTSQTVCESSKQQLHQANARRPPTRTGASSQRAIMLDNFIETMKVVINMISMH